MSNTLRQKGESVPEGRQWAHQGRAGPGELGRPGRLRSPAQPGQEDGADANAVWADPGA